MASSPASDVILSDKDYRQIATDMFQGYADEHFEGKLLWKSIKMDFKNWTKEHWDALDGKTWGTITRFCIPRGVWIEDCDDQSEVLMKLVLATKYNIDLKDWDMDRIKEVEKTYGRVSKGIHLRLQHLLGNIPDEGQQFQDTGFLTPPQQPEVEPLYPAPSKSSPYVYRRHQSQKQEPPLFSQQTPPPQHPSQSSQQQPFVSQDVRNQQYQPIHGAQHAHENQYRPSNYQPAPTPVTNLKSTSVEPYLDDSTSIDDHQPVPNNSTSEIQKDCKCIPECLTTPAPPAQVLSAQAPPVQALPASAPSAPNKPGREQPKIASSSDICSVVDKFVKFTNEDADAQRSQYPASRQEEIAGLFEQYVFKVVTPEEFPSDTQIFNARFVDKIKNPGSEKVYEKSRLVVQTCNNKDKNLMLTQLPTIQRVHIQSISDLNQDFYIWPSLKLTLLLGTSSDCVVKFATYHPHYKDKFVSNPTWTFVCAANCLYFLCGWSNLSAAFFLTPNGGACTAEPGLVTKKGKPPKTSLHLLSRLPSLPSLLFSLTLSKMRPAISEFSAMSKCATMSEWQLSLSALANFPLLADYSSVKLTSEEAIKETKIMTKDCGNLTPTQHLPEASFDLFCAAQTVEFLPDDIALLNKRLQRQINNKSRGLCYDQDILRILAAELYAMAHGFDIEKRHWKRYQIIRTKSYQHQHYGMGGTGKHEIGEYGTGDYGHLATLRKSCQCRDVVSQLVLGM